MKNLSDLISLVYNGYKTQTIANKLLNTYSKWHIVIISHIFQLSSVCSIYFFMNVQGKKVLHVLVKKIEEKKNSVTEKQ